MRVNLTYRILSGKYKGKKLKLPSLSTTRSTKTIIRESFFNVVQNDIIESEFFEVFGGSGSMGLEALSRGAKKSYFIEKDINAYNILVQNCKCIDKTSCIVKNGDSFLLFEKMLDQVSDRCMFYFDPPFHIREGMSSIYEDTLALISKIDSTKSHIVICEHISSQKFPQTIGNFDLFKRSKFGKTTLSYYA